MRIVVGVILVLLVHNGHCGWLANGFRSFWGGVKESVDSFDEGFVSLLNRGRNAVFRGLNVRNDF